MTKAPGPKDEMPIRISKTASIKRIVRQDGIAALFARVLRASIHRLRDRSIASQLGCGPLRLGRMPKVLGRRNIKVGRNFQAGDNLWLEAVTFYGGISYSPGIQIGDDVGVSDSVHIACTNRVIVGEGTLIGSRVLITDHNHGIYKGPEQSEPWMQPTLRSLSSNDQVEIGRNVWVGDGVSILPGSVVGEGSIIGANSVVVGAIPAFCIAVGQPARPIRQYDAKTGQWIKASRRE